MLDKAVLIDSLIDKLELGIMSILEGE